MISDICVAGVSDSFFASKFQEYDMNTSSSWDLTGKWFNYCLITTIYLFFAKLFIL